jgi:glucan 1,3-beta-glucosidase
MWLWVADHDIEDEKARQLNIYVARGVLIEYSGPSWIWGTSNEHSAFYQWELSGAKNIYLGHIQSETAYYQAGQSKATNLYFPGQTRGISGDPGFSHCTEKTSETKFDTCNEGWALRIVRGSSMIYVYGAGLYSFFQDYSTNCANGGPNMTSQDRIIDIDFSGPVYFFNVYSAGAKEKPRGSSDTAAQQHEWILDGDIGLGAL